MESFNLPIGTGTRQHLIDANHMERMQTHADMELIFAAVLHQILVAADTSRLQGFAAQLLVLIGDQMHAQRKILDGGLLTTQIEDADLGIGHTATEARLGVWFVLAVAIAGQPK